ncbi:OLC1v1013933C1 [Oldenlandia corymbosa var. corymbosa]|uniref:OLC1v1013933C1 n=1 Tax=Oldenlandia corymbosa var. corymbosa TaxID=529605 RepID=A0AAV1DZG6_OLDCO|nr:OLC1v1013933C1 [Oldenlandia corymbosa var. corymbosa]
MKNYDYFQNPFSEMDSSGRTTPEIQSPVFRLTSSSESPYNSSDDFSPTSGSDKQGDSVLAFRTNKKNKLEKKANSYMYRIREHVKLGPKFSETLKGKLSLGANIIRKGGRENIFRNLFSVSEGEQLLKASQCYLSTTAGPIAGILFISTEKVAFCSERKIRLSSSTGGAVRTSYKVNSLILHIFVFISLLSSPVSYILFV